MSKVDSSWKTWLLLNTVRVFFFRAEQGSGVSERASKSCASSLSSSTHSLVFLWAASSGTSEITGVSLSLGAKWQFPLGQRVCSV